MSYSPNFLKQEAERIIGLLKTDFLLEDGSFCLEKVGEEKRPYHIFPDMGDFLPFMLYFGEEEFIDKQITIFKNLLKDRFWVSEHPTWGLRGLVKSYEYTDLLYGLLSLYEFKQDNASRALLLDNIQKAVLIFRFSKNPSSFYLPKYKINLPVQDSRDGMFIELLVDLYEAIGGDKYIKLAGDIFRKLTAGEFYKKYSLLPNFRDYSLIGGIIATFKKDFFRKAEIMKYNTNCLHAFLALYRKTGETQVCKEIIKMIDSVKRRAVCSGGGITQFFIPGRQNTKAHLGASFSMIDFLCDFYYYFRRPEDLQFARKIADFWLKWQGETGLFPLYSGETESFFDFETDMSVALSKLYELTDEERYQKAVASCFGGIIKWHSKKDYVLGVDINSGKVLNQGQRTKFISLFLKLIILELEQAKGAKIYTDKHLFNLIEDR